MKTRPLYHALIIVPLAFLLGGCDQDRPTVIRREQLAFLATQQKPLFDQDVIHRLGGTDPGKAEPYYRYKIAGEDTAIDFWLANIPEDRPVGKTGDIIWCEVGVVVETCSENDYTEIIWPDNLKGADLTSVLHDLWPRIY